MLVNVDNCIGRVTAELEISELNNICDFLFILKVVKIHSNDKFKIIYITLNIPT